jgi:hypothetical protein
MPTSGKAAEMTALPQPPRTSQKVPKNSAAERVPIDIVAPFFPTPRRFYMRRAHAIARFRPHMRVASPTTRRWL